MERRYTVGLHHLADHLWLIEASRGTARFATRDDNGIWCDLDRNGPFDSLALACRAYREGYTPNVTYP
jgi:hypothetical protein